MKTYPERLLEIGIKLLNFTNAKAHTLMQCIVCSHEWTATPISKLQNFQRHGNGGCPECTHTRRYAAKREAYLARCPDHIDILSEYDGSQRYTGQHVEFRNNICGHEFKTIPTDVITGRVDCPVCGDAKRTTKRNINNMLRRVYDHASWKQYQNDCHYASDKVYEANLEYFNPNGYERTLAGVEGGHQLDHILPKAVGYRLGIPYELISHFDNLQFIPWTENRIKGTKLVSIPAIFDEYREQILEHYETNTKTTQAQQDS